MTMEFTGRLAAFPPPNLLQWAAMERASGTLVVRRSSVEKRIGLRAGRVVECRSNQPRELFGRYLVDYERVGVEDLSRALAMGRERGLPLGKALIETGLLSEEAVSGLLARWMSESVQDVFLWSRGIFFFDERKPRPAEPEVELDTRELVLEGTRWIDEAARLRRRFPDDGVVVKPGPEWPGRMLPPYDQRIARGAETEASLGALRGLVGGVDFPFLEAVARLVTGGVLTIDRHQPVEERPTSELRLSDLLAELEVQEGAVRNRADRPGVPADLLDALVPVWVQPPGEGELTGMPLTLRAFLEAIDGRTPLRRLFAPDEETRSDQLDLVLLQLRRRNLVLLPSALDDVDQRLSAGQPLRGLLRRLRG